jgi:uncharacterized repeat protein (TIGR01451 family)/fimbrial isopeptide formation D2 family protein
MGSRGIWWYMSARTRRSLTLFWTALFVCSLLMQYANFAAAPPVAAVHDEGLFELEGNAIDEATAGDDWQNGTPGAADSLFIPGSVEADGPDTTYFKGGGSKDHLDIPSWEWSSTDVAPDKDELLDVFAAVYEDPDGTIVYFGADKFDDSGDAQIGFWFFQDNISLDADGTFNGTHTVGDVLVLSDFTNGGSVDTICVYEWDPANGGETAIDNEAGCDLGDNLVLVAAGAECDVSSGDGEFDVCAVVNAEDEIAPWAFENKDGDDFFGPGQFFEGGINLDLLFGGSAPCFSSFLAETRSSQEVEAQLKDFALGSLDTCVPPTITTTSSTSTADFGQNVTDTALLSGAHGPVTGTVDFFICTPTQVTAAGCPEGAGSQVGSSVNVVAGSATSSAYPVGLTAAAVGKYCWRAEYTPDANSQYLEGSHTNATTECFTVAPATIEITKVANPVGPVNAGDEIGFDITVTNTGTGTALGVSVSDPLPAGISWTADAPTGDTTGVSCSIDTAPNPDVLTCTDASMASGDSFSVHIDGLTDAADCGTINNTATVTTTNDGSDSASASVEVRCADIDVEKTADDATVNAGEQIGFTVTLSNDGTGLATGLVFTDVLPGGPGISWSIDPASTGWSITGTAPNQSLVYSPTTLAGGASTSVHVVSDTTADSCGVYDNTASVTTGNDGSDSDSASTEVLCADIDVDKTADDASVNAGEQIGFTVTLSNSGEGDATGLVFTDALPGGPGISWSIDPASTGWSITGTAPNQSLVYAPTTLAAGASTSVHVVSDTTADSCGVYDNTASVTTGNDGSDSASDSTAVRCPDIDIDKTSDDDDGIVGKGQTVTYTINVSVVEGPVTDAVLTDVLPEGQTYVDGSQTADPAAASFEVSADGRTLTWTWDSLDNEGAVVTYDVTIDEDAAIGDQTNVAEICVSELPDCEDDDETVTVPDLTIVKSFTGNTGGVFESEDGSPLDGTPIAEIGDVLTYTLTYDLTNGPVHNGVITDTLPVGLAYITGSATGNAEFSFVDFDAATRTLTWTAPLVSADGSVTYQVTVLEGSADLPQPLVNVATIDSDETPPDDDERQVLVDEPPLAITPPPTLPPTSTIDNPSQGTSNPGFSLMLALLGLAGFALAVGFITPVPERVRRQDGRR